MQPHTNELSSLSSHFAYKLYSAILVIQWLTKQFQYSKKKKCDHQRTSSLKEIRFFKSQGENNLIALFLSLAFPFSIF